MGSIAKRRSRPGTVSILDGAAIVEELRSRGLTQSQFARLAHIRMGTVNDAIHGHPLTAETIHRIAFFLAFSTKAEAA